MRPQWIQKGLIGLLMLLTCVIAPAAQADVKGIYLSQATFENTKKLEYLIARSKAAGINTFVIDYNRGTARYRQNIQRVKDSGIRYVARIVMFPHGGTPEQVNSTAYLEKRYGQIKGAVAMGAQEIQLDYIRFRRTQAPSAQNSWRIYEVIQSVRNLLQGTGVKLQADIFGVAAHRESLHIGQNAALFANALDAICPMVYPSHFEPYLKHAKNPYATIYYSMLALRKQVDDRPGVQLYAYIELFNYRYPLSKNERINYINAQLDAVHDSQSNGWYAWSARNHYDILFSILEARVAERRAHLAYDVLSGTALPAEPSVDFN